MTTYNGDSSTYNSGIYIFENADLVLGGLAGTSNVPIKELADNSSYIKKYKGKIILGSGEPDSTGGADLTGIVIDSDSQDNILYMDETTGSFWKPADAGITSWTNIYKSAVLNVKGIKINNAGDESDYFEFSYNGSTNTLELKDEDGNYGDVRVGKVTFDTVDGSSLSISRIADDEILLLFDITQTSENSDGFYSVKRLEDISGVTITQVEEYSALDTDTWTVTLDTGITLSSVISPNDYVQARGIVEGTGEEINGYYRIIAVSTDSFTTFRSFNPVFISGTGSTITGQSGSLSLDNSAMLKWDDTNTQFSLEKRDGTLLPLNIAGLEINGVPAGFYADRVISTQTQFDELFANVDTGQDTCYLKTPGDSYVSIVENEFIALKPNADEIDGHYNLNNNIEILGDNVRIETMGSASIKYGTTNLEIRTRNDSILTVDEYTSSKFEVLSENTQRTNGENINDQVSMVANDVVHAFSDTGEICKKYSINSIVKNTKENILETGFDNTIDIFDSSDFHTTSYGNKIYHAYVDSGTITVDFYDYDSTNNVYYLETGSSYSSSASNFDNVSTCIDGTYLYIVANTTGGIQFHAMDISSPSDSFTVEDVTSSDYDNPKVFATDSNNIYILSYDSVATILTVFKGNISGGWTLISEQNIDTESLSSTDYSIVAKDDISYVTYCKTGSVTGTVSLYLGYGDPTQTGGITNKELTTGTDQGYYSKLILSSGNTGENPVYVAYNFNTAKDTIKFAEIETSGYTLTNISTALNVSGGSFDYLDMELNTNNEYISSATGITQIIGFDQSTGNDTHLANTIDNGTIWSTNTITSSVITNGYIASLLNNYLFIAYNDGTNSYLLKVYYNFEINVNETISPLGLTDVVLSENFIDNAEIKLKIDCDSNSTTDVVKFGNNTNSKYNVNIINGIANNGFNGEDKTYNNQTEVNIDDTNTFSSNISEVNHSTILGYLIGDQQTGTKSFNDCTNINVIAFIDDLSTVGNGYFDE